MEKKKKSMLAKDLLFTFTFIVILAPIVITFLLAALFVGLVYMWDGGDSDALHAESIVSAMIMIHLFGVNLAFMFIHPNRVVFLFLKTRNTSSIIPLRVHCAFSSDLQWQRSYHVLFIEHRGMDMEVVIDRESNEAAVRGYAFYDWGKSGFETSVTTAILPFLVRPPFPRGKWSDYYDSQSQ